MTKRTITAESLQANPSLILDRLRVGVLVVDMDTGLVLYSNDELARFLGRAHQELLNDGKVVWSFSNADDRALFEASARRVLDNEIDRFRLVCRFRRRDGREVCAKVLANVLSRSRGSTLVGILFEELGTFNPALPGVNSDVAKASAAACEDVHGAKPVDLAAQDENEPISSVFRFIEENWNTRISIRQLSKLSGLSSRTIHNYFAAESTTPNKFMKRLKLEHSRRMLQSRNARTTVTAVAFKCGFSNVSHFAGDYKRQFGELPSETLKSSRSSATDD